MTKEEIFKEATAVYDNYVDVLETGSVEALQAYARDLSERIIPRGVETHEVVGIVLLLRDVLARSLFKKYQADFACSTACSTPTSRRPTASPTPWASASCRSASASSASSRKPSASCPRPVLQVRERLLILPIIGVIDPQRARQLTEQLLRGIRTNRAKVVVIDITGVPAVDATVANHLVQTVDASRLMGATVIVTGLSSEIAQTLVTIGVDLTKMNTVGDLQGGIEEAERLLGYKVDLGAVARPVGEYSHGESRSSSRELPDRVDPVRAVGLGLLQLRDDLVEQVGRYRSRGVIVDVTVLDVMDSFACARCAPSPRSPGCEGRDGDRRHSAGRRLRHGAVGPELGTWRPRWIWRRAWRCCRRANLAPDAAERIAIESDGDVVTARQRARTLAVELEMPSTDQTLLATAISEIARNITTYANGGRGEVLIDIIRDGRGREGVRVVARDDGPGIDDLEQALTDGYTTGGGLGLGLPGRAGSSTSSTSRPVLARVRRSRSSSGRAWMRSGRRVDRGVAGVAHEGESARVTSRSSCRPQSAPGVRDRRARPRPEAADAAEVCADVVRSHAEVGARELLAACHEALLRRAAS